MADYTTHICFEVELPREDCAADAIVLYEQIEKAIDSDEWPDALQQFKTDWLVFGIAIRHEGRVLTISDDYGAPNMDLLCDYIQELLRRFDPGGCVGFLYSEDCTASRVGAFGGGAILVTADGAEWYSASSALDAMKKDFAARQKIAAGR